MTAGSAGAARPGEHSGIPAGPANPAVAISAEPAGPAVTSAGTDQPGQQSAGPAGPTGPAVATNKAGSTGPAGPTGAPQPTDPASPAGAAEYGAGLARSRRPSPAHTSCGRTKQQPPTSTRTHQRSARLATLTDRPGIALFTLGRAGSVWTDL
ncbi:predicted protein [Mycobacterium tuberculosis T17]|nr:predicted protein [Mycobacterium tuberculosis T17]